MSAKTKRVVMIFTAVYIVGVVLGLALFRSPGLSKAYLEQYGKDHERYRAIVENPEYHAHHERPALHPLPEALEEEAAFAEQYEARPEYQREHGRAMAYIWYFRVFNTLFFLAMLGAVLRGPILGAADGRVREIRESFERTEGEADAARAALDAAQGALEHWAEQAQEIERKSTEAVDADLAVIHEEFRNARVQLYRTTQDRKAAEYLRVARVLQEELVNASLAELEERYRREASGEQLEQHVNQFVRLMGQVT